MSENTKIEWCDHTFNAWEGCTKVSPGFANCYAENRNSRWNGGKAINWGKGAPRRRTSEANWKLPLKWNRNVSLAKKQPCGCVVCTCENDVQCQGCGSNHCGTHPVGNIPNPRFNRPRVFCASLADWLDEEVPIEWLADLLDLIRLTPNLDWLLLTKRPQNWRQGVASCDYDSAAHPGLWQWITTWLLGNPPHNVWIGTTVENQAMADERIPLLLDIPAKVRFLSCEPLLGSVDLRTVVDWWNSEEKIHWVICGGESGQKARPMNPEWARSLRDQCAAASVPFFMKQMGGTRKPFPEIPADLAIRQFPS